MFTPFRPIVRNPHVLTVLGNYWARTIDTVRFPARLVEYDVAPRTTIIVYEHQPDVPPRGQIVFVHGLEGSAHAGYIQSFAQDALARGFGVHRTNLRTCGDTETSCETMYHSGLTSDTREIIRRIRERDQGPVFLAGFSLGGNVVLKLAGELGQSNLLAGVCAVSTPIDLAACVREIDKLANYFYSARFVKRLKARIVRKSVLHPELYSQVGLDDVKTIWQFDDRFTAPLFGFGTAANYYRTQSAQNFLDAIRIPTLVIAAQDDPLVPFSIYNHSAFRENPALTLLAPRFGGHLGFIGRTNPRFWLDENALAWMESLLSVPEQPEGTNVPHLASA